MGDLTYDQLSGSLERGKLGGNYFIKTEDSFLRDEAIHLLTTAHLQNGSPDFDLDQVSGGDIDAADLASRLAMPPMLSPFRVVVVRSAQGLGQRSRVVVENALSEKVANRVFIIAAEIPRGSKAKFYTALSRGCTVVNLRVPADSELPGWLVARARADHAVELDVRAAELLAGAIGGQLGALTQELAKLVNLVEPAGKIGAEDVRAAVGRLPSADRWDWVDAVMERRFGEALEALPILLDAGVSAVALIASLSESFLRLGLARSGHKVLSDVLERDGSWKNLKWKIPIYARQARGWSELAIDEALHELLDADRLIKSGGLRDREALEEAILRLRARAGDGRAAGKSRGRGQAGRGGSARASQTSR